MSSMVGASGMSGNKIPKGYQEGQLQQYTPEQLNLFKQMFSSVSPNSQTSKLAMGDQNAFNELEAPALRQFGELQGQVASRFSGMGLGGRRGSGFKNTINTAASNFSQDLQSQRLALQRQAIMDLHGMSSDLLGQRPYDKFLVEKQNKPSFLQNLIGGVAPIAGAALGSFGGPQGMAIGADVGNRIGSAFSGQQAPQTDWTQLSGLSRSWQ